jgi:hypothetical protein
MLTDREREIAAMYDSEAANAIAEGDNKSTAAGAAQAALEALKRLTERLTRAEEERAAWEQELEEERLAALAASAMRQAAARCVQRAWRTWRQGPGAQRHAAALLLQRAVCRWLERRRNARADAVKYVQEQVCNLVSC